MQDAAHKEIFRFHPASIGVYRLSSSLQVRILLSPFRRNLLLRKPPSFGFQHLGSLLQGHIHLSAHGSQAPRQMKVVFGKDAICDHQVIDVVKHQRMLVRILPFLGEKGNGMVTPMS